MELTPRPLTMDIDKLDGLSQRLIASHHENNYAGAVTTSTSAPRRRPTSTPS
jgi:hypothetical protein